MNPGGHPFDITVQRLHLNYRAPEQLISLCEAVIRCKYLNPLTLSPSGQMF